MTRYFMKFTPLFAAEVQMMTPPRHQPRRSGRIRSSFRYSADDVRCKDCTRYDSGHPCHLNECVCLEERIEAGVVELNTLARECFGGRLFRPLQRRLRDELNTIAAHFRDTMEDRRALRGYVVDEVKRTNGQIRFEDAQDVQRQLPDDTWRD